MTTAIQPVSAPARLHGWFAAVRHGSPGQEQARGEGDGSRPQTGDSARFASSMANQQRWQNLVRQRDGAIRQEEQSHKAVAGPFATGISYDFETGPSGELVVSGGQVQVDLKPIPGDPAGTIRKMQRIQQAALSVASPSPQDREVAAAAASIARAALDQLAQERQQATEDGQSATPGSGLGEARAAPVDQSELAVAAAPSAEADEAALTTRAADDEAAARAQSDRALRVEQAYTLPSILQTGLLFSLRV